mmetsp:Transcript_64951/g.157065  ORF Transcript_64951/g.157065 Transcript_64951/m.157065 type:complete len:286 (-) Transcript_64951:190-1047(-)
MSLPCGDPVLSPRPFPAEPGPPFQFPPPTGYPPSSLSRGVFSSAPFAGIPCSSSNTPVPQQHPDISHISYTSKLTLIPPARLKRAHAMKYAPGSSSKQKKTPPAAQIPSMISAQTSMRMFLSHGDGGGFPTASLCALMHSHRSTRNIPTPMGNMKKDTAQMMFAQLRIHSHSRFSFMSEPNIACSTVGEYMSEPTIPIARPITLKRAPKNWYAELLMVMFSCPRSLDALSLLRHCGKAMPTPQRTYPAVQKNDVGSQPFWRYISAPSANISRPMLTLSSRKILVG